MEEIWKDIAGYEGLYEVSNFGRIKSLERVVSIRSGGQRTIKTCILKQSNLYNNKSKTKYYKVVSLTKDKKIKNFRVHRLVCFAFLDNPENKPEVNHIDGCCHNNNLSNLEWVTKQENIQHEFDTGLIDIVKLSIERRGEKNPSSILTEKEVIEIINQLDTKTNKELGSIYGVSRSTIYDIRTGRKWKYLNAI